jgi:hypothetical protein
MFCGKVAVGDKQISPEEACFVKNYAICHITITEKRCSKPLAIRGKQVLPADAYLVDCVSRYMYIVHGLVIPKCKHAIQAIVPIGGIITSPTL